MSAVLAVVLKGDIRGAPLVRRVTPHYLVMADTNSSQTFHAGVMPGFTSAHRCQLVIRTFQLEVDTAEELARRGVSCIELRD